MHNASDISSLRVEEEQEPLTLHSNEEDLKALLSVESLPYATPELPGIGGRLRQKLEDFEVTEIPLWKPNGHGTHCTIQIKRCSATTEEVAKKLARICGTTLKQIGFAGLKDKLAVTTQTFTINMQKGVSKFEENPSGAAVKELIEDDKMEPLLEVVSFPQFNSRKLHRGQLRGNTFKVVVTEIGVPLEVALKRVDTIMKRLYETGIPNYFGIQRIGMKADSALSGYSTVRIVQEFIKELREKTKPSSCSTETNKRRKVERISRKRFRQWCGEKGYRKDLCYLSPSSMLKIFALQSSLFNILLSKRIKDGKFSKDLPGDRIVSQYGGVSSSRAVESADVESRDLSFSLPLYGPRPYRDASSNSKIDDMLSYIRNKFDISVEAFDLLGVDGGFRPGRISLATLQFKYRKGERPNSIIFEFNLPKGSFATSVMREFMKDTQ